MPILPDAPAKLDDLALERLVSAALSQDHLGEARSLIAQAMSDGAASAAMLALCRAKIAMTARDFDAARSILVVAIEETPDVTALRSQLAEVLVAGGQAATARATIAVLGAVPVIPASQETDDTPDIDDPATRATSDS
jgi:predicted Zn-dependent protease